ncbi:hypothetical protein Chor_008857, partial [Crotalus horridus]
YINAERSCGNCSHPVTGKRPGILSGSVAYQACAVLAFTLLGFHWFAFAEMGRCRFFKTAARQFAGTCPAEARFLLWTLSSIEGNCTGVVVHHGSQIKSF